MKKRVEVTMCFTKKEKKKKTLEFVESTVKPETKSKLEKQN